MNEKEKLHNELEENYEKIVEMLSNGNFLQLNGKAINLTELNEYINAQQEEIERLKEEYMILQNASDEVEEEKDREIERQKEIIKRLDIKNLELTTIIKEVRERLMKANIYRNYDDEEDDTWYTDLNIDEVLEILDKAKEK